ncbi:hypothetical protein [Microlunatus endophyticus]|uniref:hypothetical protein n=1 Tax=Microlunatus endophyticus TaxID=1716077 RepID=UPI00166B5E7D|nr:hypothetical protein [Microlunatus endophyticus]
MPLSAWKRELGSAVRPQPIADLVGSGVGLGRVYGGKSWRKATAGFYVPQEAGRHGGGAEDRRAGRLTTAQRILDAAPLLARDAALSTWAAAYVLGADWLDGLDPYTMADLPLDIVATELKRRSTGAVRYHSSRLDPADVWSRDGLRVTSPRRTTFDAVRWAPSLEEAVVCIDTMTAFGLIRLPDFADYASRHHRWEGIAQALAAVKLARPNVRSGWETRLRMCWTEDLGLPEPLVNVPIFNHTGHFLGAADLFDPESGLVAEYDGSQHREVRQHHSDNIREEKFESANLVVVRSDTIDLRKERKLLARRLSDGYRRGQLRDRRLDDWTLDQPAWWHARMGTRFRANS